MSGLNGIDYFILSIFGFSMFVGLSRGLVKEIVSLVALGLAFVIATMYANQLALAFTTNPGVQSVVTETSNTIGVSTVQPVSYAAIGVSYGLIFTGTLLVGSIVGFILNLFFTTGVLGVVNRLSGAAFGLLRGFIINLVIIFVIQLTVVGSQPAWHQSQLVKQYQPAVLWLSGMVAPTYAKIKEQAGTSLQELTTKVQSMTQ
jgi:membrane protein required for colicin V production